MKKSLFMLLALLCTAATTQAYDLPAFPGADGYGRYVTGGRGGKILHVTNLNDSGEGSLRWAVTQSGARTVVFDVSGTIELKSRLSIKNDNITIAGQTAPGDGICIKNYNVNISANNVIVRYIRCRMGDECATEDDAMTGTNRTGVIVDHCSMSWSTDECASFYGNKEFTLQWCLISESLNTSVHGKGSHGYGGIWGGEGATFHHNLIAHHKSRTPRLCGSRYTGRPDDERVDLRNNVFYNWGPTNGGYAGEGGSYNFVNNYYKPGPSTATKNSLVHRIFSPNPDDGSNTNAAGVWGQFYVDGNYFDPTCPDLSSTALNNIAQVNANNRDGIHPTTTAPANLHAYTPFEVAAINQHSAAKAYEKVLMHVGASYMRDAIDLRIITETATGTYTYEGSKGSTKGIIDSQADTEGYITYKQTARLRDTDNDGIPNAWETANGLNPKSAADATMEFPNGGGYTAIEVYINSLVEHITKDCLAETEVESNEFFPEFVQPEYTSDDYYVDGEEPKDPEEEENPAITTSVVLAASTSTDGNWGFAKGYSISNSSNKGYSVGKEDGVKYSRNVEYTINLPKGIEVTAMDFTGYCNYDDADGYIAQLGSTTYSSADYVFPRKDSEGNYKVVSHSVTLPAPIQGTLPIKFSGQQVVMVITLWTRSTTGIETIVQMPAITPVNIYSITGQLVRKQVHPGEAFLGLPAGIYIIDGKKVFWNNY